MTPWFSISFVFSLLFFLCACLPVPLILHKSTRKDERSDNDSVNHFVSAQLDKAHPTKGSRDGSLPTNPKLGATVRVDPELDIHHGYNDGVSKTFNHLSQRNSLTKSENKP